MVHIGMDFSIITVSPAHTINQTKSPLKYAHSFSRQACGKSVFSQIFTSLWKNEVLLLVK